MASAAGPAWDPEAPCAARMWNIWCGGTNANEVDRRKAAEIEQACPQMPAMARHARLFSVRVTAWAASEGIAQFLELGAGLPPRPWLHQVARSVRPGARCAYVDSDPGVCDELDALLDGGERDGAAVVCGDVARPLDLMRDCRLRSVIDPCRPCCVLAVGVLYLLGPVRARAVMASWAALLAPGSVIAVTVPAIGDEVTRQQLSRAYPPRARYDTTPGELGAVLESAGLELVPPGVTAARNLRPGWSDAPEVPRGVPYVIAGIGRKPGA